MSEIYMIRHGQASFGSKNYDALSPLGIIQADILAEHLIKTGISFDAVFSGHMIRQETTGRSLIEACRKQHLPPMVIKRKNAFNEYDSESVLRFQLPMMLKEDPTLATDIDRIYTDRKAFQKLFQAAMTRWVSGKHDSDDSPRWSDFKYRVRKGIRELMREQGARKCLAVFTSGGPIAAAVQLALDLSDEKTMALSWQIVNASITRFKYNPDGIMLAGFNDISHLKLKEDKNLLTYR